MSRIRKPGVTRAVAVSGSALLGLLGAMVVPAGAASAAPASPGAAQGVVNLYVTPGGVRTTAMAAGATAMNTFSSIAQAAPMAHQLSANSNVVVHLAAGKYRLTSPLRFTGANSGQNGHTITYAAAAGTVMTGSQQVTGWTLQNSANNIWVASVGTGVNTRQLYVNGAEAPRAAVTVPRSDFTFTSTGMTFTTSALSYLDGLTDQNQIEVETLDSFTDRYAPVQSISGGTITMQQPAWANNTFGYDTMNAAFTMFLENNYAFLQQAGQWYLDSPTGQLFYKAASGQNPNNLDIELPKQQSLLQVSGSYSSPATGLSFSNITFTGTSWLGPSSSQGYADQQAGTFLTGSWQPPSVGSCYSGCLQFEATRQHWDQMPAAVQVSAATNITFSSDTFTNLGQDGLGIGNDADATFSGTGLGASGITVTGNTFSDLAGSGIVVGGVQADAHHPSNAAMTDQNITISDNHVTGTGTDYRETPAILSTYVTGAMITHNQVDHLPYDGIDIGWGWGINDPGGSQDYVNRGTYNFQPIYTTATTLKNNTVSFNLIFDTKNAMHDGGSIYNLSANPGSVIEDNYMFNNNSTVALYLDEGSRYLTVSNNVVQGAGVWAFTNANANNNTDNNTFSGNWFNGGATQVATGSPHNNVLSNNVQVSGTNWPSGAQQVISQAGIPGSSTGGSSGEVHAVGAGKCLDVPNLSTTAGTQLDIWSCNGGSNQIWTHTSSNQLTVYSGSSQMCLDAFGNGTTAGTKVDIWSCNGGANQQWNVNSNGTITGVQSGLCLDVTGASTANGALVELWTCNGRSNQQWTLG